MNIYRFLINDITTTPDSPPEFQACREEVPNQGRDMGYPRKLVGIQSKAYPELVPFKTKLTPDRLFTAVQQVAQTMPHWWVLKVNVEKKILEAIATTKLLGFKDDIIIEVRQEVSGSSVHARSKSRTGKGDLGTNAKRLREFFSRLSKQIL